MTTGGVVLPLELSHRLLAEIVGARRPTVSTAIAGLEREGKLLRRDDATWLLTGDAPGAPAAATLRVISHRRRLSTRTLKRAEAGPGPAVPSG
jgi:hypothetical protein